MLSNEEIEKALSLIKELGEIVDISPNNFNNFQDYLANIGYELDEEPFCDIMDL